MNPIDRTQKINTLRMRWQNVQCQIARRKIATLLFVVAAIVAATPGTLCPLARALPVARFKKVRPTVQVSASEKAPFVKVSARGALFYRNVVRTGAGGSADILFSNGTQLAMKANTRIAIAPPQGSNGALVIRVFGALSEVFVRPKGNTQIRTMAAIAAARGTEFLVRLPREDQTEVIVNEGSVDFSNDLGRVVIHENERSAAAVGQAPTPPQRVDVTGFLQWTADITALPLPLDLSGLDTKDVAVQTARAQIEADDVPGARATLRDATTSSAATLAGWLDLRDGAADNAQTEFRSAIARDANNGTAHAYLALAQLQLNQVEAAQKSARTATGLQPASSVAQSALALTLFFAGDDAAAGQAARRAGALDPLSPLAALLEGRTLLAQRQLGASGDAFARAVALLPNSSLARVEYGRALLELDQLPKARTQLEAARRLDDNNRTATTLLAVVLQRQGESARARELYLQVLAQSPSDVFARGNYAQLLLENGELSAAQRELLLVPNERDDAALGQIFVRLSEIALYQQNPTQALQWAQRAVRLLPDSSRAHYQLGRVYLEQERLTQAEQQFRLAVVRDPQFDRARYALGVVRQKTQGSLLQNAPNLQGPVFIGSAGGAGQVQNLQSPGAEQRIQGFSGDPLVAREAVRSYGDSEAGLIYGQRNTLDGAITHAQISRDRRGIYGGNLERQQSDGVRDGADRTFDRAGLLFGQKSRQEPSSVWALADYEKLRQGQNKGEENVPFLNDSRFNNELKRVTLGFNRARDDRQRTRGLLLLDRMDSSDFYTQRADRSDTSIRSHNVELRHDVQLNARHHLSAGLSIGQRRRAGSFNFFSPLSFVANSLLDLDQQAFYLRDEWQANERLQVIGEMGLQRLKYRRLDQTLEPMFPDEEVQNQNTVGVPNLVLNYRAGRASELRLRARRVVAGIDDFSLLQPNDVFFLSFDGLPGARTFAPLGSGRRVELEMDHTFANASLLTLGVFQSDLNHATALGSSTDARASVRGLQGSYEGLLTRDTSFFVRALYNSSRNRDEDTSFGAVPHFIGAAGLQFFNRQGIVLQASTVYQTSYRTDLGEEFLTRLGGFGVLNLRAAKRFGLRSSLFLEVNNALDKNYTTATAFQPGRQLRVGLIQRF